MSVPNDVPAVLLHRMACPVGAGWLPQAVDGGMLRSHHANRVSMALCPAMPRIAACIEGRSLMWCGFGVLRWGRTGDLLSVP